MASKGKGIADGYGSSGKRKRDDSDKAGRRRKNPGVLQFFDDAAYEIDESESSDDSYFDDDFLEEEFGTEIKMESDLGKAPQLPVFPKEEQMSEDELDKMMEERYKPGAGFVTFAEDRYDKRSIERNMIIPSAEDPTIWKVKCVVGRERHSAFCLMQKYVDLRSMGTKLNIISAFALDHVKGFIFIEADKQCDLNEACTGLCSIYFSRAAPVPKNEVSHLLSVRNKSTEISVGTWARVKSGKYKGDLAQIFAVNDVRKKATVKLIPRIDLQALAQKFGGGATVKKNATPAPRLISSSELEEFRPLIQYRRDRDTGKDFEVLDGMLLKDGYLYKKVPIDSLSLWGVIPTEDELLKFETPSKNDESNDLEWLSQLYGEEKKTRPIMSDKGGGKGEGSSSSSMENCLEVHDLVLHGRKGFGVIIGMEKDDSFRVLKEGTKGPVVVSVKQRELKKASFDKKFTAFDQHKKTISLNDTVRVLEGPLEDRQGIVKQIYRGTIFLYDENEQENGGYFCSKAQMCEKVKVSGDASKDKGGESGFPDFEEDPVSSPKSQARDNSAWDNNRSFNREDNKDEMFSVGQSLRIRVGPLKGYLCRVLAIRRSDVTVKLDSQHKILTVKSELLAEVRGKSSALSTGDDPTAKPFDLLGTQDGTGGWMDGAGTSAEGGWNAGGSSTERGSWPAFSSSSAPLQSGWGSANPLNSGDNDLAKDAGGSAWDTKVAAASDNSSWGKKAAADEKPAADTEQVGGWGKSTSTTGFGSNASDSWGAVKKTEEPWGDKGKSVVGNSTSSWGNAANDSNNSLTGSWGKGKESETSESTWGKAVGSIDVGNESKSGSWGNPKKDVEDSSGGWGKANSSGGSAQPNGEASGGWKKDGGEGSTSWGKGGSEDQGGGSSWGNKEDGGGSSWGKPSGGSSWGKPSGGSSWGADDTDQPSGGGGRGRGRGGGGGRGSGCFKCGEEGHMSRECPSGGGGGRGGGRGGGGGSCYKCGEEGHFSRECPNGGGGGGGGRGGGGGSCFKCGEEGHFSRECPSGGGGGRGGGGGGGSCYKCGEEGHFARECPSSGAGGGRGGGGSGRGGGGGGGGGCYKCGEDGHFARECPSGGGGGGKDNYGSSGQASGGWSSSQAAAGGWSSGGQSSSGWGSKSGASDGGAQKETGTAPSWSSGQASGGWGSKSEAFDGAKKESLTGDQTESWGSKPKAFGGAAAASDGGGSSWSKQTDDGAGSSWGKLSDGEGSLLGKPPDIGGSSWGKPPSDGGGSLLGKPPNVGGSSWGKPPSETGGSSWSKTTDGGGSSWGKPSEPSDGGGSSWGKPADGGGSSWGKAADGGGSSWSKPADGGGSSWGSKDDGGFGSGGGGRGRGGGGGRGSGCFKCGEEGHMSRECPSGGGGGGGRGRGGGGGGCYKCGEDGHFARECPSAGGGGGRGGGGCYKCGEDGHFARECPSGGGGGRGGGGGGRGGGGCFKCGEDGHFARECPNSNS